MNIYFKNNEYYFNLSQNKQIDISCALIEFLEEINFEEIANILSALKVNNGYCEIGMESEILKQLISLLSPYSLGGMISETIIKKVYNSITIQNNEIEKQAISAFIIDYLPDLQKYTRNALLGNISMERLLKKAGFNVFYKLIYSEDNTVIECYSPESIKDYCMFATIKLLQSGIKYGECGNCNKLFIMKREDEKYCDRVIDNKACKSIGYHKSIRRDELKSMFRTAYNTRNARKNRHSRGKSSETKEMLDKEFLNWAARAKEELKNAQNSENVNEAIKNFSKFLEDGE